MSRLRRSTSRSRTTLAVSLALLLHAGCSEDVTGPGPVIDDPAVGQDPRPVDPGIVCRDQLVTDVVLTGERFSPVPIDIPDDPRTALPDVTLTRTSALDGGAADPAEVLISGDPDTTTNMSLLSWQSQQQMTLRVLPSCASDADCADGDVCHSAGVCAPSADADLTGPLDEGVYDVQVRNPNDDRATSLGSLAVIGKPTLSTLAPPIVCLAQGQREVTLSGTRFLTVESNEAVVTVDGVDQPFAVDDGTFTGCADIPHAGYSTLRYCTGGTVTLPQDSVAVGYPGVTVDNPETAACVSEDVVNLRVVPPPTITAVSAIEEDQAAVSDGDGTIVCLEEGARDVVIHGVDMLGIDDGTTELLPSVTVDGTSVTVKSLGGTCEDLPTMGLTVRRCTELTVELPTSLAADADPYQPTVEVTNPDPAGCDDSTAGARQNLLTVAPPPDVVSVEPPLICLDDGDRMVVVHGTDFLTIDGTVPAVDFGGVAMDPGNVTAQGCASLDVAGKTVERCDELAVTIPQMSLDLGQPTVTVVNPMPAGCSDSEDGILTVVEGPEITAAVPPLVCTDDGPRSLTIQGTGFLNVDGTLPTVTMDGAGVTVSAINGCASVPVDGMTVEQCTTLEVDLAQGALAPGDTVVVVENPQPAGCTATDDIVLTVPPVVEVVSVDPGAVCVTSPGVKTLTISGTGFLRVDGTDFTLEIDGSAVTPDSVTDCTALTVDGMNVESCDTIVATYDTTGKAVGPVPIAITNPDPSGCGTINDTAFNIAPPPTVTGIEPAEICEDDVDTFTLTGSGFVSSTAVSANDVAATSVTYVNDTELEVTFADGLPAGDYDITVDNGEGCQSTATAILTVHPMPLVFFVDPPVVFNGITTEATIYVSNLDQTAAAVQLIAGDGTITDITDFDSPDRPGRIQAQIPAGLDPGTYEVSVTSVYACTSTLNGKLTVTDQETLTLGIEPQFASPTQPTAVTVTEAADGFVPVPRVYLNPAGGGATAAPLRAVVLEGAGTLSGVVPGGLTPGDYDVIAVNPTGEVGVLQGGLTVTAEEPPLVTSVAPATFDANTSGQSATIFGANFGPDPMTVQVTTECADFATGAAAPSGTVDIVGGNDTAMQVSVDMTGVDAGSVCLITVENPDGSTYVYSAVSVKEPAQNLNPWIGTAGGTPSMQEARRALSLVTGRPTDRSRFLYAIGGDDGDLPGAKTSVESVPVGVFGDLGAWTYQRNDLSNVWDGVSGQFVDTPRTFAEVTRIGRFIYLTGGSDPVAGTVDTVLRAQILDPLEGPEVLDLDAALGDGTDGLGEGIYYYRVAAVFPTTDPSNPGGESLPGEIFTVQLPQVTDNLVLTLTWQEIPGASGYRIYRTPAVDDVPTNLQLMAETTGGDATSLVDDGTHTFDDTQVPFVQGSLGVWHTVSPMNTARHAHATTSVRDPADPTRWFLYAAGGWDSAGAALATGEVALVTVQPDGGQVVGAWAPLTASLGAARAELGGLVVTDTDTDVINDPGDVYVFFTQGRANNLVSTFEVGQVGADGDIGSFTAVGGPTPTRAGAVDLAANGWLFILGGANGSASNGNDTSSEMVAPAPTLGGWDALGGGTMTVPRIYADGAKESAFFFIAGGSNGTAPALSSVEQTVQ